MGKSSNKIKDFVRIPTNPEAEKYKKMASTIGKGSSFGNEEVKRAIAAGYTMDDVNGYLKYSGITPNGDFAVGGYTETERYDWGTKDSGSVNPTTTKDPFYRYVGAAPSIPQKKPDPAPKQELNPVTPPPQVSPVNPELSIPPGTNEMNVGDSIRLIGENIGIKAKRSSAQRSRLTSKGTGRLTIPRSSGYQALNLGM